LWIVVALCVLVPFLVHRKPSDLYFAPTPVWTSSLIMTSGLISGHSCGAPLGNSMNL
jgi:hypothetical protein